MKAAPKLLVLAVLAALSTPALAETSFDVIGGSEISFEGLLQADYNRFNSDIANLNGALNDGLDSDSGMRRAELVYAPSRFVADFLRERHGLVVAVIRPPAASGGAAYPIPVDQMVHGAAVTEAVIRSAASGKVEKV